MYACLLCSRSLTADTVHGTLDHITGKPVVDSVLAGVVQDMVKLEAKTVLPVVVHPGGGHFDLLLQLAMVNRYRLPWIVDGERFHEKILLETLVLGTTQPRVVGEP